MWATAGRLVFLWFASLRENSVLVLSRLNDFFLQITEFQTSSTQLPIIQMTSFSIKQLSNIKLRNSKLEVFPWAAGNIPSSLCLTQNQASLTSWHSQKMWTLSWRTPQCVQFSFGTMWNLLHNLSLLGTMLCTIKNSTSLCLYSSMCDCKRIKPCPSPPRTSLSRKEIHFDNFSIDRMKFNTQI